MFLLPFSILFLGVAIATPAPQASSATSSAAASTCTGNSVDDRSVWCDYNTSTDYYNDWPDTGVTKEYWFELTNTTASPDGVERIVLSVNGSIPGPTIEANWGDTVIVHVLNSLENNGTGIHFHGIRQLNNNQNDGVPSITQCPTAPGESITYTWQATQYGTSWYHSHFSLQAWEGVFGPILIHGPATANYDEDIGHVMLSDWTHQTICALYSSAETNGPPTLDNGLINGVNVYEDAGSRWETTFESGKKYLLRIVNTAIDTYFKFSIDNHTMTVIAADFVPIVPYETEDLSITMGQRYDVIVEADQDTADYWMRATMMTSCSNNDYPDNTLAIVRYDNSSTSDPTSTGYTITDECVDEDSSNLVPYLSDDVGDYYQEDDLTVAVKGSPFKWYIGGTTMSVEWDDPTLLQVYNNESDWSDQSGVFSLDTADDWYYVIIETTAAVPHPIHLHGHDFYILASGTGAYDESTVTLTTSNPPRRDVANLPADGYLVLGFYTDNPGAWLMHCHIGWHTSEGLALQYVERYDEIASLIDYDTLNSTCAAWDSYQTSSGVEEEDSGV